MEYTLTTAANITLNAVLSDLKSNTSSPILRIKQDIEKSKTNRKEIERKDKLCL